MSNPLPSDGGTTALPDTTQSDEPVPGQLADRRRLDSRQLLGAGHEVEISHAGAIYRLRRTALDKLILTK